MSTNMLVPPNRLDQLVLRLTPPLPFSMQILRDLSIILSGGTEPLEGIFHSLKPSCSFAAPTAGTSLSRLPKMAVMDSVRRRPKPM